MSISGETPPLTINGWKTIFVDDFAKDCPPGEFVTDSDYRTRWDAYPTGWRTSKPWQAGMYDNSILEVSNSCLIKNVKTVNNIPRVAAPRPKISEDKPWGVKGGRFSIRFKIDPLPGYKVAWLLWPDSGDWPKDGEIDFPESNLDTGSMIRGFVHKQDATDGGDQYRATTDVLTVGEWHTATVNWKPGDWRTSECSFILDHEQIGKWTTRIPNGPMHWVIQTEPMLRWQKPDPKVAGRIFIDWVVGYAPN